MPISPLMSIPAVAVGALALSAADKLVGAIPFAEMLTGGADADSESRTDSTGAADPTASLLSEPGSPGNAIADYAGTDQLRRDANAVLKQFQETFLRRLAEAGIDPSRRVQLRLDRNNRVTVASEHPDREQIERILAEDPVLRDTFSYLAATLQLIRLPDENCGFGPSHTDAGAPGVAISWRQPARDGEVFHLTLDGDDLKITFQ